MLLHKAQVQLIESDVETARITINHLSQELVDHICCEVENEMANGKTFEEAYAVIKEQAGIKVLQKIQEHTLYLTDKNYAIMKTTMKITGNVSLAMLGLGTVMKIYHWPGANITLVTGFALLSLVFFPAAIYLNYKQGEVTKRKPLQNLAILSGGLLAMTGVLFKVMHWPLAGLMMASGWLLILFIFLPLLLHNKLKEASSKKEKQFFVLGVVAVIIFELSAIFKIMHWPGASVLMILGSVMLVCCFLPAYTYSKFKETGKITGQFIFLVILSIYAVVLTSLMAMNVSSDVMTRFVNQESNASKINNYLNKKMERIASANIQGVDSSNERRAGRIREISEGALALKETIRDIKLRLIKATNMVDDTRARQLMDFPSGLEWKDNYDIMNHMMLEPKSNGLANALKVQLDNFSIKACAVSAENPELTAQIKMLLDTSTQPVSDGNNIEGISWEEHNFRNNILISTLALLSNLEKKVGIAESKIIIYIQK